MAKKKIDLGKQGELAGMPEHTPLGQKAIAFLNAKEKIEKMQLEADGLKKELITEFINSGQKVVRVAGHQFTYMHKESESIVVKEA